VSISAIGAALPALPTQAAQATGASAAAGADGTGFSSAIADAVDNLSGLQGKADDLALQAATGQLTDVHDYMLAASEANLATELTVAVRNKAVEAFNEIMRMGV
jgi:flagellar hook-basal body complex protein FliE